jgi:hypothetical protein
MRKKLLSSRLSSTKKQASLYPVDSFKSKREKFYEKLKVISSNPTKSVYKTLAPVLTTENKTKNSDSPGKNIIIPSEKSLNGTFDKFGDEKTILNLGYKPVNQSIANDLSKTQRFEISPAGDLSKTLFGSLKTLDNTEKNQEKSIFSSQKVEERKNPDEKLVPLSSTSLFGSNSLFATEKISKTSGTASNSSLFSSGLFGSAGTQQKTN